MELVQVHISTSTSRCFPFSVLCVQRIEIMDISIASSIIIIIIIIIVIICKFLVRLLRYEHRYITTVQSVQSIKSVKDQKSFYIKNRTKSVLSAVFWNPVNQQRRAEGPPGKLVAQRWQLSNCQAVKRKVGSTNGFNYESGLLPPCTLPANHCDVQYTVSQKNKTPNSCP